MKKILYLTITLLMFASSASALSITLENNNYDVGGIDDLMAYKALSNSGNEEIEWLQGLIGADFTMEVYDTTSAMWIQTNEDVNAYAIDFRDTQPEYFFIKVGDGNTGSEIDHFLYSNLETPDWGVISIAGIDEIWGVTTSTMNDGRISHVGEINPTAPVPEPATMLLLGAGLLGLAGFRRKVIK